jgi:acyl-CoA thioesterase I
MRIACFVLTTVVLFIFNSMPINAADLILHDNDLVITLGNSITQMGEDPGRYVFIMRKVLDTLYPERTVYIVNVGIGGHKSTDMNARFQRDVLQYKPTWVTISVGVNDVWHGFDKDHPNGDGPNRVALPEYERLVTDMVKRAQAAGIKVAIFTATVIMENLDSPENSILKDYNQALRTIAKKYNCMLVDMDKTFRQVLLPLQKQGMPNRGVLTYDGVHMTAAGDWLMAKTALTAFGVPDDRIDMIRPAIEKATVEGWTDHARRTAVYSEVNHEVGAPRPDEKRIVMFGSSSVDNWNLAKDFPTVPILNRGISGEDTRQMVLRLWDDMFKLKPYAAIIFFGSCNDFWPENHMPVAETKSNIIKIARLLDEHKIKIAFGAISPVNDYLPGKEKLIETHPVAAVQEINAWLKSFCSERGYVFADFYTPVADSLGKLNAEYSDDGMHCNGEGYKQWQPVVMKVLEELDALPEK